MGPSGPVKVAVTVVSYPASVEFDPEHNVAMPVEGSMI